MTRFITLFLLIGLVSCNLYNSGSLEPESVTLQQSDPGSLVAQLIAASELTVATFIEDGRDKTDEFSGFRFDFRSDGTVIATRGEEIVSGTYRVFRDDGKTELSMWFPARFPFYELSDDWYFRSKDESRINFDDDDDRLVLEFL
ncbi:hypothetical protein ADIS_2632 [Lunatimonas lonarensis]|uniref:Uncharacterized protein n=1 Tax=Lunatimonas lonarensis TaxID=1232681 RepID=R7ZRW0_9BACT|nr:hypothetical protein [Lunatimonas lonarensis]EON76886.1 hypothetical protein ADIS_2632 [Lunatimonas lonarensis]